MRSLALVLALLFAAVCGPGLGLIGSASATAQVASQGAKIAAGKTDKDKKKKKKKQDDKDEDAEEDFWSPSPPRLG